MASRANHRVLLGCGLLCVAALLCVSIVAPSAAQGPSAAPSAPVPVAASNFPIASDARLAGDGKQTRFILDLDKPIQFRAFALADPYRVVVDIPQVSFKLAAGTGAAGRGLVKAFRYGLVMPGGSRIVFDLTGPAKIAKSYVLEPANGQPPRLVIELEEVDRTAFVQLLAPENRPELRPAIADANAAAGLADASAAARSAQAPDARPLIVIDPGHGGIDEGTAWYHVREKDTTLAVAQRLEKLLRKQGIKSFLTRSTDRSTGVSASCPVAFDHASSCA